MNDDIPRGDRPAPSPKTTAPKRTRNAASTAKVAATTAATPLNASPLANEPAPMDAVGRDLSTPDLFGHPDAPTPSAPTPSALAPDIRDRPAGEYHGQPYGGRTAEPRSWWDKTRDRLGAMLGDEEARRRLQGEPSPEPGVYDSRRDDTGWSDPVHPDNRPPR
ncbi:MAG: hypothetical protein JSR45_18125 [Proteobacteria bacterium]|nr:hypothetical protein [Pseudomonadota bacterium]